MTGGSDKGHTESLGGASPTFSRTFRKRLRLRLRWTPRPVPESSKPSLILYARKDDAGEPGKGGGRARHCMEILDRPTILPITHDPRQGHVPPDALQTAPPKGRGGNPHWDGLAPWIRPLSKAAAMGAKICVLTSPWGDKLQESLSLGGQPFFLDILHSVALTTSLLGIWNKGSHCGPTPGLAGHLATQEGAAGVPGTPSPHRPG